jgi:hypothetical protein
MKNLTVLILMMFGTTVWADCRAEMDRVDSAWTSQYHTEKHWWQRIVDCEICDDTELRKDAIITKEDSRKIGFYRNVAYSQLSRGDEKMCLETIKIPKRILRLN